MSNRGCSEEDEGVQRAAEKAVRVVFNDHRVFNGHGHLNFTLTRGSWLSFQKIALNGFTLRSEGKPPLRLIRAELTPCTVHEIL